MKTQKQEQEEFESTAEQFADAAFPVTFELQYSSNPSISYKSTTKGISKREYFAAMALQGVLARSTFSAHPSHVEDAVKLADLLIEELSK